MFERTLRLINEEELSIIRNKKILLIGVGGVGGYILESLVRMGFSNITIIDKDKYEESNLNRQIGSTRDTLGIYKTDALITRAKSINPNIKITGINKMLTVDDITIDKISMYDFIIDACDDVKVKVELFKLTSSNNINFISSMGTGNRFHPELLDIKKLKDTANDPLAKKIRHELKKNNKALNTKVLISSEVPMHLPNVGTVGTVATVPMAAGAIIASYVFNKILDK